MKFWGIFLSVRIDAKSFAILPGLDSRLVSKCSNFKTTFLRLKNPDQMKRRDVCLNVSASNQTPFQLPTSVLELFDSHLFITVCSRTYPCVSFRCQRVSHPGSKPGSRGLDGDGITDACQFPACCKEMGKSGVTPGKPVLFQRYSLTAESLYSKCK